MVLDESLGPTIVAGKAHLVLPSACLLFLLFEGIAVTVIQRYQMTKADVVPADWDRLSLDARFTFF
ncbi:hypothetical protein IFT91_24600 [Pseudomonas fluorescens]|nr:hypothetical protein [Pseudomonas fluorescens]